MVVGSSVTIVNSNALSEKSEKNVFYLLRVERADNELLDLDVLAIIAVLITLIVIRGDSLALLLLVNLSASILHVLIRITTSNGVHKLLESSGLSSFLRFGWVAGSSVCLIIRFTLVFRIAFS